MSYLQRSADKPRIGMLWGDFPWEAPPPKVGKLLSTGVVARNVSRALTAVGEVVPFERPRAATPEAERAALASFLRSIDVLWADVYPGSARVIHLRHELGLTCPAILYAGGAMPKGLEAMLFPWQALLRPCDGLLVTCEADRAIWRRLVRRSALREWVVPLAVDETVFHPRGEEERRTTRRELGIPATAPLLLYVGRLNVQKNLHTLLRLLAEVRRTLPEARLGLIGEEDDIVLGEFGVRNTGYVDWLHHLAAALGVADGVTFVEPRFGEDLARVYAAADVLVNLSFYHRENFGLSQAEAQACGTPVVCTAWGGFKDVVHHGETGYLVDAILTKHGVRVDWATGARHIARLLTDARLRASMGKRAAQMARERYSIAALARALGGVVADVCGSPGPVGGARSLEPAYEPSRFARRYEAHKRACGWYADDPASQDRDDRPRWYPPMFQGRDYVLYETLMGPYATALAADLAVEAIVPEWIPYVSTTIELDRLRLLVRSLDPVWPHESYLRMEEWEVLSRVDGVRNVEKILASLRRDTTVADLASVARTLWSLRVEGFVMFRQE